MSKANLEQLYSLRRDFTIIGLTGRIASGCSEISKILSNDFVEEPSMKSGCGGKSIKTQKREITQNFCEKNWKKYKVIEYKKVLLFLLLPELYDKPQNTFLFDYYRTRLALETDPKTISNLKLRIQVLVRQNEDLINKIKDIGISRKKNKSDNNLYKIGEVFWSNEFNSLADNINGLLFNSGVIERKMLLHHISNNYRSTGKPYNSNHNNSKNIFLIAKVINKLIKATKIYNDGNCHVVIDSLKNSLEINFFKERYSAFYLVAVKNDDRHNQIGLKYKLESQEKINRLIEIDDDEYACSDYSNGLFFAPDIQNCIQISDYHINVRNYNPIDRENSETFFTIKEQVFKLQALIQQPSLVTPEPIERIMQLAFTARLNSGCISRQVGAAITDPNYSIKAIGWNDVPKGTIPCSLRNIKEINTCGFGFSDFEKGLGFKETEQTSVSIKNPIIDDESSDFHSYISKHYTEQNFPILDLNGRNCPYCFKTAYNSFKGDKNQVHTRSLHAEENAMLQISKFGGQALEGGYLFTTASTCELCAKKAYQLGIHTIYYIDPYPGISRSHILKNNPLTDPKMVLFSGAVGKAYLKFYEPFMPQKDELSMLSNEKLLTPQNVIKQKLQDSLKENNLNRTDKKILENFLKDQKKYSASSIAELIITGLKNK